MALTEYQKLVKHGETHSPLHMANMKFAIEKLGMTFNNAHRYALKSKKEQERIILKYNKEKEI